MIRGYRRGEMEENKNLSYKNVTIIRIIDMLFYAGIVAMFAVILLYGQPVFAINDDLGLYNVLSGAFTGTPSAYISFMEYPLSWVLAMLYRMWGSFPWYGAFLEATLLACAMLGYRRCTVLLKRNDEHIIWALAVRILFCASWLGMTLIPMLRLQYTVVAAVCGATALFLFVTSEDTESVSTFIKQNVGTIILALLAESIRPEMMLMLLGFAGMMWIGRLSYRLLITKEYWLYIKRYLYVLGIFVAGLVMILLSSQLAYRDADWQHYREVDRYRVKLFDYYGYPSYDANEEYFTEHGIDRASYEAVANQCMYPGRYLSVEQWSAMVELAKEMHSEDSLFEEWFAKIFPLWWEWLQDDGIKPVNQILILWYIVCLCLVLVYKSREGGVLLGCMLVARIIGWAVLVYRGRCPDRIAISIFWMEFAVLSGVILRVLVNRRKRTKAYVPVVVCAVLLLILGYWDAGELYRISHEYNTEQKEVWDELKAYCHAHDERLYIMSGGSNTIYYYYDTPFENLEQYENYIPLFSGHMMNPNTAEKLAGWEIEDLMDAIVTDERVYLIFEEGKFSDQNTLVKYYRELYDSFWYEQLETFEAGSITYQIYRFGI